MALMKATAFKSSDPAREAMLNASAYGARGMPPIPLPEVRSRRGRTVFHVPITPELFMNHQTIANAGKRAPLFSNFLLTELKKGKFLGSGSWANVYSGTLSGVKVMIKEPFEQYPSRAGLETLGKEIAAARNVLHRFTVSLYGACVLLGNVFLAYEWAPLPTLRQCLDADDLDDDFKLRALRDLAKAMEWLHCGTAPPIPHMDLTSYNVFVDNSDPEMTIRVGDFGLPYLKKIARNPDPNRKSIKKTLKGEKKMEEEAARAAAEKEARRRRMERRLASESSMGSLRSSARSVQAATRLRKEAKGTPSSAAKKAKKAATAVVATVTIASSGAEDSDDHGGWSSDVPPVPESFVSEAAMPMPLTTELSARALSEHDRVSPEPQGPSAAHNRGAAADPGPTSDAAAQGAGTALGASSTPDMAASSDLDRSDEAAAEDAEPRSLESSAKAASLLSMSIFGGGIPEAITEGEGDEDEEDEELVAASELGDDDDEASSVMSGYTDLSSVSTLKKKKKGRRKKARRSSVSSAASTVSTRSSMSTLSRSSRSSRASSKGSKKKKKRRSKKASGEKFRRNRGSEVGEELIEEEDKEDPVVPREAWVAPELLLFEANPITLPARHNEETDVYSYGVILWEVLTGETPYKGQSKFEILQAIKKGHRFEIGGVEELSSGFTRIVADLVRMCCSHEPRVRPSFSDILYVLDFVLEPNKQLGLGKTIPASVWKMLERTERKTPIEELEQQKP